MLKNFLVVTARHLLRQQSYFLISLVGLAGALFSILLIFLWIQDELQTDAFHKDSDRMYRLLVNIDFGGGGLSTWPNTSGRFGDDLRDNFSDQGIIVTTHNSQALLQVGENNFREDGLYTDPEFFRVFSFDILQGVADSVHGKHSIAVSQRLAIKLFGNEDPINKVVRVNGNRDLEVKAVFASHRQSSLTFDFVMPLEIYREAIGASWSYGNYNEQIYLKLKPGRSAVDLASRINAYDDKRALSNNDNPKRIDYWLQPFREAYLNGKFENGRVAGGRIEYVRIFSLAALVILLVACINFTNLSTAQSTLRTKEVGIRKVAGAGRSSLVLHFLGESVLLSSVSMCTALILVLATLPFFNDLTNKALQLHFLDVRLLSFLFGVTILSGLLGGIYPAVLISSFKPATILKGNLHGFLKGSRVRSALVVVQFAATLVLVASVLIIYDQIRYIQQKNPGYDRAAMISFNARISMLTRFDAFRHEVNQLPGVVSVSRANENITSLQNQNNGLDWPGEPEGSNTFFRTIVAEHDFPAMLNLRLKEGRLFEGQADTLNFILNERAVEVMGLNQPIGVQISQWGFQGEIVGIVENFHVRSMHEAIDPVVIMCASGNWPRRVYIRLAQDQISSTLPLIERLVKKYSPESPFEFSFLDEDYNRLYSNEQLTATLATLFTILTVVISGLGLLGLTAYTVERKRKEIAIRITLGATVSGLVSSMTGGFIRLVLLSCLVAIPVSYVLMVQFLDRFAFKTELDWKIFALAISLVVAFSISIVISQVLRATSANPATTLKCE